ncbi:29806_t:CDS:2, partial [Gigaspora margarita]
LIVIDDREHVEEKISIMKRILLKELIIEEYFDFRAFEYDQEETEEELTAHIQESGIASNK